MSEQIAETRIDPVAVHSLAWWTTLSAGNAIAAAAIAIGSESRVVQLTEQVNQLTATIEAIANSLQVK